MNKILPFLLLLVLPAWSFGQCTPVADFGDEPFGVSPDTVQNFTMGLINNLYTQQIDVKVPADGSFAGVPFIMVDSAEVLSISGLPNGLELVCNPNATADCTYLPDSVGCALITGIPTESGTFDLVINLRVYTTIIPYDLPFTGYRITIEGPSAVANPAELKFSISAPLPNPANEKATFIITAPYSGTGKFRVFDLVGKEIYAKDVLFKQGKNRMDYGTVALPEGIYLYRIDAFNETITSRMVVTH